VERGGAERRGCEIQNPSAGKVDEGLCAQYSTHLGRDAGIRMEGRALTEMNGQTDLFGKKMECSSGGFYFPHKHNKANNYERGDGVGD
jgi:hypothetical protein